MGAPLRSPARTRPLADCVGTLASQLILCPVGAHDFSKCGRYCWATLATKKCANRASAAPPDGGNIRSSIYGPRALRKKRDIPPSRLTCDSAAGIDGEFYRGSDFHGTPICSLIAARSPFKKVPLRRHPAPLAVPCLVFHSYSELYRVPQGRKNGGETDARLLSLPSFKTFVTDAVHLSSLPLPFLRR